MSIIEQAALSAFFGAIFTKINASLDLPKFASEKEVLAEIKKWKQMLGKILDVLDDAEEKQMTQRAVKNWLSNLEDLAYDVEDVLDEFATESLRRELEKKPEASNSKLSKLIPSYCTAFSPRAVKLNYKMDSKIKKITARLQEITAQRYNLDLKEIVGGTSRMTWQRNPSTYLEEELCIYGRDEDKKKVLDFLLRNDAPPGAKFGVLPIVGMGGLGKTTLARAVYNHELLQQHFHPKAWVCVSDDYDLLRITKSILESITLQPCDLKDLNQVQDQLQKKLTGKMFLIVLDDVWSESYDDWIALRPPFMVGAPGSRIIVTTRSEIVAQNMGTVEFHTLECISDDNCWELFRRHAIENRSLETLRNLEVIRKKVTSKCAGLPLAARTLGGLLCSKPGDRWEEILNSKIWSLQGVNSCGILPVLRLSYHHLPSYLKRCFRYCAVLPKDYEFTEMELVLLWMAEGLIQQVDDDRQLEDIGSDYFYDLLSRSLFQAASVGGSKYVMHDLVNDLAQSVGGDICFRLEDEPCVGKQFRRERVRFFSYSISQFDDFKKFQPLYDIPHLRTFLPLSREEVAASFLSRDVIFNLLPKLQSLRALSFKGYQIFELPDSIGDLKHLRYLDLSFTKIRRLPELTILLCNLQTLILRRCENLKKLPSTIEKWVNLRYLDIEGAGLEKGLPLGLKDLASLRTLTDLIVSKASGVDPTGLKKLRFLRGGLRISGLENVTDSWHGREAKLKEKKNLHVLSLEWKDGHTGDERFDRELLDGLQPHVELKELNVKNYGGFSFPLWVGDHSFYKLAVLRLQNCRKCTSLPKLGLLSLLRELVIKGMPSVKSVGCEFYGEGCSNPFPSLETMCFEEMEEWEDWDPCGFDFPCLVELTIGKCPKLLGKSPNCLSNLNKLVLYNCEKFITSLPSLPMVPELRIEEYKEVEFGHSPKLTFKTERLIMEEAKKSLTVEADFLKYFSYNTVEEKEKQKQKQRMLQLEALVLRKCESFGPFNHMLKSLRHLAVENCPKLVSFQGVAFPFTLRSIRISNCCTLASLPIAVGLQELKIIGCDSLISIGSTQLPFTLKRLVVIYCKNLGSLQLVDEEGSFSSMINLEFLLVELCPSLVSLSSSSGLLPPRLKNLHIRSCSKLESIAESFHNTFCSLESIMIHACDNLRYLPKHLYKLIRLDQIYISHCESLVSFPEGGLPTTCLKIFQVSDCRRLETLPQNIHKVTVLKRLRIKNSGITLFPEEGFPTNLTKLYISNVRFCKPLFEWGLHKLTFLTTLSIYGGCPDMLSFPCDDLGMMLPPSLINLQITYFPKLECLSTKGFENLTSLEYLSINNCQKLKFFPKGGLPLSLLQLYIYDCPFLEQKCQKDKGQEWFSIARIPCVNINRRSAFYPEQLKKQ